MKDKTLYHGTDVLLNKGEMLKADPNNSNLRHGVFATSSLKRAETMGLRAALKDKVNYVVFFSHQKEQIFHRKYAKRHSKVFLCLHIG